jgi:cytochrome c peroxidase
MHDMRHPDRPFLGEEMNRKVTCFGIAIALLVGVHLKDTEASAAESTAHLYFSGYVRASAIPFPKNNPFTQAKVELGRTLFFDPRLSASEIVSCATCHNPALSWGDGLSKGVGDGMKALGRHTPTLLNLAWTSSLFWDGRADSLEEQALGAIQTSAVMNLPLKTMVERVKGIRGYRPMFKKAFPREGISDRTIARAIATFERTVVSGTSPFDRWNQGDDRAISDSAKRGFLVFNTKGRCVDCHGTWRFTEDDFQDIGLPDADLGRGQVLPQVEGIQHAFKTPTLRNVALRAPYMHDGSMTTLAEVVEHYNKGGAASRPSMASQIKPLHLTEREKEDLVSFLRSLTGKDAAVQVPRLPR